MISWINTTNTQKTMTATITKGKMALSGIKTFWISRYYQPSKKTTHRMRIFSSHVSEKRVISNIYRNIQQSIAKHLNSIKNRIKNKNVHLARCTSRQ